MLNYRIMFVLFASFWLAFFFFPSKNSTDVFIGMWNIWHSKFFFKQQIKNVHIYAHMQSTKGRKNPLSFWSLAFRWIPWYLSIPELHPIFYLGHKCGFEIKQRHSNCNHIPPQHKMSLSLLHELAVSTQYRAK